MDIPDDIAIPDEEIARLQKPEALRRDIEEGKSLQEIIGYSDEKMASLYEMAYTFFQEGKYSQAYESFLFLTTLNPYVYAYWLGFAMSCQLQEEYEQAILGYECASGVEPDSPLPYYYIAGCHLYLNEIEEAERNLFIAKRKCAYSFEHQDLISKIERAEQTLKKRGSSKTHMDE